MSSDPIERRRRKAGSKSAGSFNFEGMAAIGLFLVPVGAFAYSLSAAIRTTALAEIILSPSTIGALVVGFIAVIILNGVFVSAETALDLLKNAHVKVEEDEGNAHKLNQLLVGKSNFVAAAFMGSMTMRAWMILLCIVPAKAVADGFGGGLTNILLAAVAISIPVAGLNVIFGELIPRSYAKAYPARVALRLNNLVRVFATVFWIPTRVASWMASLVTRKFGADASFEINSQAEEEIKSLIETYSESGEIVEEEIEMLGSVFDFGDTVAREIMTPRVDLDSIPIKTTLEEAARLMMETGHSRLPVYEGTDDQIHGIVHAKDILGALVAEKDKSTVRSLMRPAIFVPENKSLHNLLEEMRQQRTQMVVVQDEFGGTAGIVTIEDIVEEVMGDIVDEYDNEEPPVLQVENGWIIEGRLHLDDVNDEIESALFSDEFDTLGGYVFGLFGRQPNPDESVEVPGYRFTVKETDGRRIMKILVESLDTSKEVEAEPV